mmetsp:Transcript_39028/g.124072  ORF Transcript_39028/g.124072 Transcript_39028/m.124072 type:complete len:318 (-) Transcript_39028:189-1142(-)
MEGLHELVPCAAAGLLRAATEAPLHSIPARGTAAAPAAGLRHGLAHHRRGQLLAAPAAPAVRQPRQHGHRGALGRRRGRRQPRLLELRLRREETAAGRRGRLVSHGQCRGGGRRQSLRVPCARGHDVAHGVRGPGRLGPAAERPAGAPAELGPVPLERRGVRVDPQHLANTVARDAVGVHAQAFEHGERLWVLVIGRGLAVVEDDAQVVVNVVEHLNTLVAHTRRQPDPLLLLAMQLLPLQPLGLPGELPRDLAAATNVLGTSGQLAVHPLRNALHANVHHQLAVGRDVCDIEGTVLLRPDGTGAPRGDLLAEAVVE